MKKAVLFLTFNRPETTKRVFEAIRKAKPPRLYLASDGPRAEALGESELIHGLQKSLLDAIDWECDVKTLFRDKNLGCGRAVSTAITWFFKQESEGIIIEDDCLPDPSFFNYCETLLDRYRDNKKIMHISGDQLVPDFKSDFSYYFAKIQHCWGWASWADRWASYNFDLNDFDASKIKNFSKNVNVQEYWSDILEKMKQHQIDTWDYQWVFAIIARDGLCINPSKNLVSNIGFGEGSTHTPEADNPYASLPTFPIGKIINPKKIVVNQTAVDYIYEHSFGIKFDASTNKGPTIPCRICHTKTNLLFDGLVLNKYQIKYFKCPHCEFIQTEKPYWLDEAYGSAITTLDVGLVSRNLEYSDEIGQIIKINLNPGSKFLDYAGGYGLFVRIMRDRGFDFYREDKYCENLFAENFDIEDTGRKMNFEAVTAFEVFEHLGTPLKDIGKMLSFSDTLIFSTELQPKEKLKSISDWWYFAPETGQHISFYTAKTLRFIADKYNLNIYSNGALHLLSKRKFNKNPLLLKDGGATDEKFGLESLLQNDYELAKELVKKTIENKKEFASTSKNKKPSAADSVDKLVDRLSLVYTQIDQKEKEIKSAKVELSDVRAQLDTKLSELKSRESELQSAASELSGIYASRSWRVLATLRKILTHILPVGSRRRKVAFGLAKKIWGLAKLLAKSLASIIFGIEIMWSKLKPKKKRAITGKSKKIVYIGHSYHKKTKSTAFLIDYLKKFYQVTEVLDESWRGNGESFPDLSFIDESYLGIIFFQSIPSKKVLSAIKNDNLIFFPMYDGVVGWGYAKWRKLRNIKIMNFSSTLHKKLKNWGFGSSYVQYFPKPSEFIKGKKDEVFFWQRVSRINISTISAIFDGAQLKLHIHRGIDPGHHFLEPTAAIEKKYHITYSDWFETPEEMRAKLGEMLKQKGIYVAPREYEGIGLSFLEAMAMGKAVIAVDNPTMNEYIVNNKTGYLFNLSDPKPIDLSKEDEVQRNAYAYMSDGYKKWESEKHKIIEFIESE